MTNYTPNPNGPLNATVPLLDTTDLALGGSGGNMNVATKKLADNDAYLASIIGGFANVVQLTNSGGPVNITTANLLGNLVVMYQIVDGYFTGNMPDCSTYKVGAKATIKRLPLIGGSIKPVTLTAAAGQSFFDKYGNSFTSIYLHDGETVTLYNTGSVWVIIDFDGNYYNTGDQMFGYYKKPGTLVRDGSVYNRADYPRLWQWIQAQNTAGTGLVVSDATWLSFTAINGVTLPNASKFSLGDGSTTFRVPDDRGSFDRGLGGGRDADRIAAITQNTPGDLQADAVRSHTHTINQSPHTHGVTETPHIHSVGLDNTAGGSLSAAGVVNSNSSNAAPINTGAASTGLTVNSASIAITNNNTGGSETRPVNVGKWPLLVY